MSCNLIFVRHGQSLGNLNGAFLGDTDLDLSPTGYNQADCTAEFLKTRKIDVIYSSDLLRAYNTALPTAKTHELDIIKCADLRELHAGDWENQKFDTLESDFKSTYGVWLTDIGNSHAQNGESVADLQKRIIDAIKRIAESNDGKTVAVFTHATPIKAFFCYAYGKSLDQMKDIPWVSNASVSEVEYNNGKFTPISYGNDSFLENLKTVLPKNC